MTPDELDRALRQLRLGGMAGTLTVRAQQARAESLGPVDFLSLLVHDELQRRRDRLVERRVKHAGLRDQKTLDTFNWGFNAIDRALIFELATGRFIEQHEDCLILGNAGVGKSHLAQGIAMAAIHAGFRVLYREAHRLFEDLVLAAATAERTTVIAALSEIPLLIIDDLGMRKLPAAAAEDCSRSSCAATNAPPQYLLQIGRLKIGQRCLATHLPSPHSSTDSCTTAILSRSAARATDSTNPASTTDNERQKPRRSKDHRHLHCVRVDDGRIGRI